MFGAPVVFNLFFKSCSFSFLKFFIFGNSIIASALMTGFFCISLSILPKRYQLSNFPNYTYIFLYNYLFLHILGQNFDSNMNCTTSQLKYLLSIHPVYNIIRHSTRLLSRGIVRTLIYITFWTH